MTKEPHPRLVLVLVLVLVLPPKSVPVLAGNPGNFSLKTVTETCFALDPLPIEDEPAAAILKITTHIGSALPPEEWETGLTSVHWHCKWNIK